MLNPPGTSSTHNRQDDEASLNQDPEADVEYNVSDDDDLIYPHEQRQANQDTEASIIQDSEANVDYDLVDDDDLIGPHEQRHSTKTLRLVSTKIPRLM